MLSGESFWNLYLYEVEGFICCSWIWYWKPSSQYSSSRPAKIPAFFWVAPSQLFFISCKVLQKWFFFWVNVQMDAFLFVSSCNVSWWFCFSVQFCLFLFWPFANSNFLFLNVLLYTKSRTGKNLGQGHKSFMSPNFCFGI